MSRRSNFIDGSDDFRERNLRFVRNELEENINQFFSGDTDSAGAVNNGPPPRDSIIIQPTPGDRPVKPFRSVELDQRSHFLRQLGVRRSKAHALAVASLKVPDFNLLDMQQQRHRMIIKAGDECQTEVDAFILREITDMIDARLERLKQRPRTPPAPRNIDWHCSRDSLSNSRHIPRHGEESPGRFEQALGAAERERDSQRRRQQDDNFREHHFTPERADNFRERSDGYREHSDDNYRHRSNNSPDRHSNRSPSHNYLESYASVRERSYDDREHNHGYREHHENICGNRQNIERANDFRSPESQCNQFDYSRRAEFSNNNRQRDVGRESNSNMNQRNERRFRNEESIKFNSPREPINTNFSLRPRSKSPENFRISVRNSNNNCNVPLRIIEDRDDCRAVPRNKERKAYGRASPERGRNNHLFNNQRDDGCNMYFNEDISSAVFHERPNYSNPRYDENADHIKRKSNFNAEPSVHFEGQSFFDGPENDNNANPYNSDYQAHCSNDERFSDEANRRNINVFNRLERESNLHMRNRNHTSWNITGIESNWNNYFQPEEPISQTGNRFHQRPNSSQLQGRSIDNIAEPCPDGSSMGNPYQVDTKRHGMSPALMLPQEVRQAHIVAKKPLLPDPMGVVNIGSSYNHHDQKRTSTTNIKKTKNSPGQKAGVKIGFCVKSFKVNSNEKFFINVCQAPEVPPPKDITDGELITILESTTPGSFRVPMSISETRNTRDRSNNTVEVCDIAINPTFLSKIKKSQLFNNFFLQIVAEALSEKYNIQLTMDKTIILSNRKFIGTLVAHRVRNDEINRASGGAELGAIKGKESSGQTASSKTSKLVEEIDKDHAVNIPKSWTKCRQPLYKLRGRVRDEIVDEIHAELYLPNCVSSHEFNLDIGEDRILLESMKHGYIFDKFVNYRLNSERAHALFDKTSKMLQVRIPVLTT